MRARRYVIAAEGLFALAYVLWAVLRAYQPDIFGTEKFMDFGFMNAILKSPTFPPNDMWLSGNSINYYYFGYVLMAALTGLSGVSSQVDPTANVTLFALTALGAFGLVYNLIAAQLPREGSAPVKKAARRSREAMPAKYLLEPRQLSKPARGRGSEKRARAAAPTRTWPVAVLDPEEAEIAATVTSPVAPATARSRKQRSRRSPTSPQDFESMEPRRALPLSVPVCRTGSLWWWRWAT